MSRRRTVLRGSELLDDLPETVASRSDSQIIEIQCCLCQIASPWGSHASQPPACFVVAVTKLEALKIRTKLNHFALRANLYLKATRIAFDELRVLRANA